MFNNVHAYQALVRFSTWIDFNIEGDDTGFLAWRRKKMFPVIKNVAPKICELDPNPGGRMERPISLPLSGTTSLITRTSQW